MWVLGLEEIVFPVICLFVSIFKKSNKMIFNHATDPSQKQSFAKFNKTIPPKFNQLGYIFTSFSIQ